MDLPRYKNFTIACDQGISHSIPTDQEYLYLLRSVLLTFVGSVFTERLYKDLVWFIPVTKDQSTCEYKSDIVSIQR